MLVGLLVGLLRRRLLVGLLRRRSAFRRRVAPSLLGGLVSLPPSRRPALLFGELFAWVRLLGVARRVSGFPAVLEAVSAPLRRLVALHRLMALRRLVALLGLAGLLGLPTLLRLVSLLRSAVLWRLLARLSLAGPSLVRLLVFLSRLLVASHRLLMALHRLLVTLRGAPALLISRVLFRSEILRGYLLPRDVIALVSRLAAVSEGRVLLLPFEVPGRGLALAVVTAGNGDVLPL